MAWSTPNPLAFADIDGLRRRVMRFGASSWAFTFPFESPRDDALVERMQALGCDHFELGGESLTQAGAIDTAGLRSRIRDAGMTASVCGIFTQHLDLSSLDPEVRRAGMAYLRSCIDTAEAIGATVVVGAFCGVGGTTIPTAAERRARNAVAAAELRSAGQVAASAGVRLGLEPLNRYENNFLNTVAQAVEIVDAADHPAVGVHLDLFHGNIEEGDLRQTINLAGRRLVHCHAVDTNRAAPGSGHMPWASVAGGLADIGYRGALVIETFDPANAAIAALASFWRPFAASQDDLVRDGVAFLRRLVDAPAGDATT
jgi:D-psicose/D-tagatose/L-ribulose 3-epimerase